MLGHSALGELALGEFRRSVTLVAGHAALNLSGQNASLLVNRVIQADHATINIVGQSAEIELGSYSLEGAFAGISISGMDAYLDVRVKSHRPITGTGFRYKLDDPITVDH